MRPDVTVRNRGCRRRVFVTQVQNAVDFAALRSSI